jgi:hypothetical protein
MPDEHRTHIAIRDGYGLDRACVQHKRMRLRRGIASALRRQGECGGSEVECGVGGAGGW